MQRRAAAAPSPASPSFAGMLADFAAPEKKFPPARDLGELADDIATLSYEQAVRRYQPSPFGPRPAPESSFPPSDLPRTSAVPPSTPAPLPAPVLRPAPQSAIRKDASVTVRLTQAESDRLRARSAEAGLTVSAYLRSCAFEVEALRAQVKQTLAELKQASHPPSQSSLWSRLRRWRLPAAHRQTQA